MKYLDYEGLETLVGKIKEEIAPKAGTTAERPTGLTLADAGFQYYDTTLTYPIYWDGYEWVDVTGAPADAKKKGLLSQRPDARNTYIPVRYMYMWEKVEYDEITGGDVATGEVVPIFWTGQDWRDSTGEFVATGTIE